MKRILTLLILSFLVYQAQAQVIFSQDFQSGTIAPMTAVDVDGKILDDNVAGFAGPTWKVVGTSNLLALSTSWFKPPGQADDWLISPAIPITVANTFLFWEAYTADPAYRDGYQVRISTTDNQIASFTTQLLNVPQEFTVLTKRALKLDAFIGDTIYFAFRNNSIDKFLLYMDNISVLVLPEADMVVKSLNFEKYNPIGTSVPLTVTVENNGATPINSVIFTYTVGSEIRIDTVTGLNIPTRGITDITHSISLDLNETGEYPVTVVVEKPNNVEENASDNTIARNIYGLNEQLPKKVVVEEGTGTWCGWCPRGFVAMERIAELFPEVAIPIAIHNFDPMTVEDYDTPFSQSISGYPSGHVDRKEINIDPESPTNGYGFDDAIVNLQNRMVPVAISIETAFDDVTRMAEVTATAHLSIPTQSNNLRFAAVLTENGVTGPSPEYDQVNYYSGGAQGPMGGFESWPDPVPANQLVYNFVARALFGTFFGLENSIPAAVEANEDFTFEFNYQVPAGYNVDEMQAIVFVVDDETGEILNAESVDLSGTTSVPLFPIGHSVLYPNPATDYMNLSIDFQTVDPVTMTIFDTHGRMIKSLGTLDLSAGATVEKIDVSEIHSGNYILELRHKNSVTALPFTRI
ncbi:MAG: choice-of-anchor J domain-containing protein [Saprospiraceae bacterium]